MILEDHFGDILRKARKMRNVSLEKVALASGVSDELYSQLESNGLKLEALNVAAVADCLGLNALKLERIANGWLPKPVFLERWRCMKVFSSESDGLKVNAFLAWDPDTGQAALFDTGVDALPVCEYLLNHRLELSHIFITHSHWDHVDALGAIRAAYPKAAVHSGAQAAPKSQRLQPEDIFVLGNLRIQHRPTPGHAEDGVIFLIEGWSREAPMVAIVGDTIFAGSMGNGNGQWELARQKIRQEILSLLPETLICPGHGPLTTVGEELENNPFF